MCTLYPECFVANMVALFDAHGRIIKWTQHIGFLTLNEIAQVVEGNNGNKSKRR